MDLSVGQLCSVSPSVGQLCTSLSTITRPTCGSGEVKVLVGLTKCHRRPYFVWKPSKVEKPRIPSIALYCCLCRQSRVAPLSSFFFDAFKQNKPFCIIVDIHRGYPFYTLRTGREVKSVGRASTNFVLVYALIIQ